MIWYSVQCANFSFVSVYSQDETGGHTQNFFSASRGRGTKRISRIFFLRVAAAYTQSASPGRGWGADAADGRGCRCMQCRWANLKDLFFETAEFVVDLHYANVWLDKWYNRHRLTWAERNSGSLWPIWGFRVWKLGCWLILGQGISVWENSKIEAIHWQMAFTVLSTDTSDSRQLTLYHLPHGVHPHPRPSAESAPQARLASLTVCGPDHKKSARSV